MQYLCLIDVCTHITTRLGGHINVGLDD
jgi:hypothetical protein